MKNIIWIGGEIKDQSIEDSSYNIVNELENKLSIQFDIPIKVRLHQSRVDYEKQLGRSGTQDWEVGNTSDNNEIDILHPDVFEKDSSHKKEDFIKILKHEIVHIVMKKLAKSKAIPMWLNEGLSMYLAEQTKQYKNKNGFYVEVGYASKLATQFGWNQYSNYDAYRFAGLFVNFLVENYKFEEIIRLIKSLSQNYYQPDFEKVFKKVLGDSLSKVEVNFVKYINTL